MFFSFIRRFFPVSYVVGGFALLFMGLGASRVGAAEKERREPDGAAFNSDATLIVYIDQVTPAGAMDPATTEIWTVFPNGQGKQRLTSGHKDKNPHFSPDGKHIVFERDGDGEIWMMNSGGDALRNVTNTPDISEREAQFANDGQSLFLLSGTTVHYTKEELDANPMLNMAQGSKTEVAVRFDLKDGTRHELLSSDYSVQTVFPDPDDDKVALVICVALKANGKPVFMGDNTLVAVPLDGSAAHTVFTTPKGYYLKVAKSGGETIALDAPIRGELKPEVFLLKKAGANAATQADMKAVKEIYSLTDLSCDGKNLLGLTAGYHEETGFYHGLAMYDIATGKLSPVVEE